MIVLQRQYHEDGKQIHDFEGLWVGEGAFNGTA